jgi:hypothetical protein
MEQKNEIVIDDLRRVINEVLDFIELDLQKKSVPLTKGLYWTVPTDEQYDMTKEPAMLNCGDLRDDLEFLKSNLDDKECALPLQFLHVAPILRFLALHLDNFK